MLIPRLGVLWHEVISGSVQLSYYSSDIIGPKQAEILTISFKDITFSHSPAVDL